MAATHGFRAAFQSHDTEQSYVTVMHFLAHSGAGTAQDLANLVKAGAFPTALAKTLQTDGTFDAVTVTNIRDHGDTTPPDQYTASMTVAGAMGRTSNRCPRAVTGLCRLKSNVSGRGTHGWVYGFPVITEGWIDTAGKTLITTYWTQLQAMATALNAVRTVTGALDDYDLVVFSRARWARGESNFLFGVSAVVAMPKVHWLKRRELI